MRLWLVRHGETEANVAGLYSGHAPTPLTEKGIGQAKTLHTLLRHAPFDRVLCSELERARHTARLVLEGRDVPQHILPELNEMYFEIGR
ncbi:histidine phosphatase family protein, partial [Salmonella enterica]|uniref:histidine phosphatase family protein n=1 Tax=Salmonella enterica TaxID=28901 RepID=UPI0015909F79